VREKESGHLGHQKNPVKKNSSYFLASIFTEIKSQKNTARFFGVQNVHQKNND